MVVFRSPRPRPAGLPGAETRPGEIPDAAVVLHDPRRGRARRTGASHRAEHAGLAAGGADSVLELERAARRAAEDYGGPETGGDAIFAQLRDPVRLDGRCRNRGADP